MKINGVIFLLIGMLLVSGCGSKELADNKAALVPAASENGAWQTESRLTAYGEGNLHRIMKKTSTGEVMLELTAGKTGQLEYTVEEQQDITAEAKINLQFLSTQGTGVIKLSAVDAQGGIVSQTGLVYTGQLPPGGNTAGWQDERYKTNFQGGWIEKNIKYSDYFGHLPSGAAVKYRLSVEVGQGQHALLRELSINYDSSRAVKAVPAAALYLAQLGDVIAVEADVENSSSRAQGNIAVELSAPYGYGVLLDGTRVHTIERLEAGEKRRLQWLVKVNRPDAVNLNAPWPLTVKINGQDSGVLKVAAADSRPGKVFYVMTEDLEPIDSAGYPKAWGNGNGWLDPEEFLVQMVHKPQALNRVAEKHGAKWTHYIAWPAVKAAEWAARQSATGNWPPVISAIEQGVTEEAKRGHEYGIHLHSDYDPLLPENVLSYNAGADGLWANHLRHGWAHSVAEEGEFAAAATRTGMLYRYQCILEQLAADSPQGQLLTARVGSFDFGDKKEDVQKSTSAYRKVGLWGSSDADGNTGKAVTAGEYGQEIYLAGKESINRPAPSLSEAGVVEFRPTPREFIMYDVQSAAVMNQKTDQGMSFFTGANGAVKPGVHAVIGFTHAMFVMGEGGWQSTEGGQFKALDEHLSYVRQQYVNRGVLQFATATELVEEYLDYYAPQLLAVYGARRIGSGEAEYAVRLLGRDIQTDSAHPHTVTMKYPLYLRDSAYRIKIFKNGQPIYSTWGLPTPLNDIQFQVDDKQAVYTMRVYHNEYIYKIIQFLYDIKGKIIKTA